MITAKVTCAVKDESGEGDDRRTRLVFGPDYAPGRNAEWAYFTPGLSLDMTVRGPVGDAFVQGRAYTLQFVESDD